VNPASAEALGEAPDKMRTCPYCDSTFVAHPPDKIQCGRCRNKHRKAKRRARGEPAPAELRELYDRIKVRNLMTCQHCGQPCVLDEGEFKPDGASIQHVVPVSEGGAWDEENLITVHHRCHKVLDDQVPSPDVEIPAGSDLAARVLAAETIAEGRKIIQRELKCSARAANRAMRDLMYPSAPEGSEGHDGHG
jgi:5-methylcytosine-specific restriction endonuclease McrA